MSDGHHHDHERPRDQGLDAFFRNFRTYQAPFHVKLALAFRNNFIKLQMHSECCGHPGQPGC